jgi:hypothetical protein
VNRLAIGLCFYISVVPAFARQITPEDANQIGQAYGAYLGFVKSMDYVSATCGADAKNLSVLWTNRNQAQQAQVEALLQRFIAQMVKQYGQKQADQFQAQLHAQVDQMQMEAAPKGFAKLTTLPPDQKSFVCRKFAASVQSGEWDIEKKKPALYKYLATQAP